MLVVLHPIYSIGNTSTDSLSIDRLILQFKMEEAAITSFTDKEKERCKTELSAVKQQLRRISLKDGTENTLKLLLEKERLEEEIEIINDEAQIKKSKLRYKKGIELTRLLYEKILGLDHHFSSSQTTSDITKLSNPHNFPEFVRAENDLKLKIQKQTGVALPKVLDENSVAAASFLFTGMLMSEGDPKQKISALEAVACILDFTLRMSNGLNLIYYETEYLKQSNQGLKKECLELFNEYAKVVGYLTPLDKCREMDDWEALYFKLDDYIADVRVLYAGSDADKEKGFKKLASIEFPVNLLIEFIHTYNNFIGQGEHYYQKFEVILGNYQNEATCSKDLPEKFHSLRSEIKTAISKFNEAYNIQELSGSKMKDLIYGED
jgi:hypothetical protein